jgi:hypothetical protein
MNNDICTKHKKICCFECLYLCNPIVNKDEFEEDLQKLRNALR